METNGKNMKKRSKKLKSANLYKVILNTVDSNFNYEMDYKFSSKDEAETWIYTVCTSSGYVKLDAKQYIPASKVSRFTITDILGEL